MCVVALTHVNESVVKAVTNETAGGTYSDGTKNIVRDIGRRLTGATGQQRETFWLLLRLSLPLQRGKVSGVLYGEEKKSNIIFAS